MKLRNKDDGRVREFSIDETNSYPYCLRDEFGNTYRAKTLKEIADKWKEIEESKEYWFIDFNGEIKEFEVLGFEWQGWMKEIGNYFETKEEAERAAEKLKAWTRLEDKAFRFTAWKNGIFLDGTIAGQVRYEFPIDNKDDIEKDLDLLFGGEE